MRVCGGDLVIAKSEKQPWSVGLHQEPILRLRPWSQSHPCYILAVWLSRSQWSGDAHTHVAELDTAVLVDGTWRLVGGQSSRW